MGTFKIEGGHTLTGEITPQGAKNEALQVICATLLTEDKVRISNIPDIIDVNNLINILRDLGVVIKKNGAGDFTFESKNINLDYISSKEFRKKGASIRGSVMIVGPLLARFGKCYIPSPGGDKIGRRKLDVHFDSLVQLGAKFEYDKKNSLYSIKAKQLKGTYIHLEEASVTGTANILMAAVLSKGKTTIYNAACEPYIQQLCKMIQSMGADISGIGSNLLTINGVEKLSSCEHRILPDMIEIGSWIGLAAVTKSELTIKDVSYDNLGIIPHVFKKLGIKLERRGDDIYIPKQDSYEVQKTIDGSILTISDAPWPGFTPDLISIILVTAIQAKGTILIHQKMFESRLFFVDRLLDMGAQIILCDPHRATVVGLDRTPLRAITMSSPDIRAGISLLIAALSAEGTSTIHNIEQIDRGYENIDIKLRKIGAKIDRL